MPLVVVGATTNDKRIIESISKTCTIYFNVTCTFDSPSCFQYIHQHKYFYNILPLDPLFEFNLYACSYYWNGDCFSDWYRC